MMKAVTDILQRAIDEGITYEPFDMFLWKIGGAESIAELDDIRAEIQLSALSLVDKRRLDFVADIAHIKISYIVAMRGLAGRTTPNP